MKSGYEEWVQILIDIVNYGTDRGRGRVLAGDRESFVVGRSNAPAGSELFPLRSLSRSSRARVAFDLRRPSTDGSR
jgi:hypothetical protein